MNGRRRERRKIAVGVALLLMAATKATPEDMPERGRPWLLMQEAVSAEALVEHDQQVRVALGRLRSSQPIEIFLLRDEGFATFVATTLTNDGHGIEALDTLPRALVGLAAPPEGEDAGSSLPPARLLWDLPALGYQPKTTAGATVPPPTNSFFRYEFYRVDAARVPAFEQMLERRRDLFRDRTVQNAYDVLGGNLAGESQLFALATGAESREALDLGSRKLRQDLGRPGRRLERELAQLATPAGALEGVLSLTWSGTPAEATFAARGRLPGSWTPTAVALEPLSPPPRVLVEVPEPLPLPEESTVAPPAAPAVAPTVRPPLEEAPDVVAEVEPVPVPVPVPVPEVESEPSPVDRAEAAVRAWASAWAGQDVERYLGHYAQVFQPPPGKSRAQWQAQRRERLTTPTSIEVRLDDVRVDVLDTERARVTFRQRYRANNYSDVVVKRLDLIEEAGVWRIQREIVVQP